MGRTSTKAKTRDINDDTELFVYNNTSGSLGFENKDGMTWFWERPNDEQLLTVGDIKQMKGKHVRFLKENWIRFNEEDKDVLDHLRIAHYFNGEYVDINELVLKDEQEIEGFLFTHKGKPTYSNYVSQITTVAKEKIQTGELNSANVIRYLEKKFKLNLDESE